MSNDIGKPNASLRHKQYFALGEDGRTPFDVGDEASFVRWWNDGYGFDRVAETTLGNYIVSTVFFGHAIHGPDKLFETIIYEHESDIILSDRQPELAFWRCATWDDAERQHQAACDWLRDHLGGDLWPKTARAHTKLLTRCRT